MNEGQKMFHDFYMSMVQAGKEAEAEALLAMGFRKQDEGTFDAAFLQAVTPRYYALIRPTCTERLEKAMARFSSQL